MTIALAVAMVVASLALVWLVRFSPVLSVRQVEVRGTSTIPQDQVSRVAQVPVGTPLAQLDSADIAQRVSTGITAVEGVQVHTRPPGTVVIEVTERRAVFHRRVGARLQAVDAAGVVFADVPKPVKGVLQAETATVDNRLLADVASVVASLPPEVASQVQVVRAGSPDRIELALDEGRKVIWGSAAASQDKGRVLQVLLGEQATVFDVSSPATPSTR